METFHSKQDFLNSAVEEEQDKRNSLMPEECLKQLQIKQSDLVHSLLNIEDLVVSGT